MIIEAEFMHRNIRIIVRAFYFDCEYCDIRFYAETGGHEFECPTYVSNRFDEFAYIDALNAERTKEIIYDY